MEVELDRRVYKPELKRILGVGETWLRSLEVAGKIPPGRTDPGGKRKFWLASEVQRIVAGQQRQAERVAA